MSYQALGVATALGQDCCANRMWNSYIKAYQCVQYKPGCQSAPTGSGYERYDEGDAGDASDSGSASSGNWSDGGSDEGPAPSGGGSRGGGGYWYASAAEEDGGMGPGVTLAVGLAALGLIAYWFSTEIG